MPHASPAVGSDDIPSKDGISCRTPSYTGLAGIWPVQKILRLYVSPSRWRCQSFPAKL